MGKKKKMCPVSNLTTFQSKARQEDQKRQGKDREKRALRGGEWRGNKYRYKKNGRESIKRE